MSWALNSRLSGTRVEIPTLIWIENRSVVGITPSQARNPLSCRRWTSNLAAANAVASSAEQAAQMVESALHGPPLSYQQRAAVSSVVQPLLTRPPHDLSADNHVLIASALFLSAISPPPDNAVELAFTHAREAVRMAHRDGRYLLALLCLTGGRHSRLQTFDEDSEDDMDGFVTVVDDATGAVRLVDAVDGPGPVADPKAVVRGLVQQARLAKDGRKPDTVPTPAEDALDDVKVWAGDRCMVCTGGRMTAVSLQPQRDVRRGVDLLRRAAMDGHVRAMVMAGLMAVTGKGTDQVLFINHQHVWFVESCHGVGCGPWRENSPGCGREGIAARS